MKTKHFPFLLAAIALAACTSTPFTRQVLRVGITPGNPPLNFMQNGRPAGVEADLARALGTALNRPVAFVPLSKNSQYAALVVSEVDILMSGIVAPSGIVMNVTFMPPYSTNGPLVWAVRAMDKDMRHEIEKHLAAWYADGSINRALERWHLPPTAPKNLPPPVIPTNFFANATSRKTNAVPTSQTAPALFLTPREDTKGVLH